eukprot:2767724-Rhodomonas_salina.3
MDGGADVDGGGSQRENARLLARITDLQSKLADADRRNQELHEKLCVATGDVCRSGLDLDDRAPEGGGVQRDVRVHLSHSETERGGGLKELEERGSGVWRGGGGRDDAIGNIARWAKGKEVPGERRHLLPRLLCDACY